MTEYMTDKEEIDMLKRFWHDYGKSILFAVILGVGIGYGYRYWLQYKTERNDAAANVFTQLVLADREGQPADQLNKLIGTLKTSYARTPYASFGAMLAAKQAVNNNDNKAALADYDWIIAHAPMPALAETAGLRAARVALSEHNPKAANQYLDAITQGVYQPLVEAVRGDVLAAEGKPALAHKQYQQARDLFAASGMDDPLLDLKLSQG